MPVKNEQGLQTSDGRSYSPDTTVIKNGKITFVKGAVCADNVTLDMEQDIYEGVLEARLDILKTNCDTICANLYVASKPPILVKRPKETGLGFDGQRIRLIGNYKTANSCGWYVPVPADAETTKLVLYHPITGMPFEVLPFNQRDQAVKRLMPYMKQLLEHDASRYLGAVNEFLNKK